MKAEDLKTKTKDELQKTLLDLKKQQFNLRFQLSQGQLENTAQLRATRRDVARVKTFMNTDNADVSAKKQPAAKKATAKKTAAKKSGKKTEAA